MLDVFQNQAIFKSWHTLSLRWSLERWNRFGKNRLGSPKRGLRHLRSLATLTAFGSQSAYVAVLSSPCNDIGVTSAHRPHCLPHYTFLPPRFRHTVVLRCSFKCSKRLFVLRVCRLLVYYFTNSYFIANVLHSNIPADLRQVQCLVPVYKQNITAWLLVVGSVEVRL